MSKPEPDGNRSLEQILATIRESLAEESADPPAKPVPAPAPAKTAAAPAATAAVPRAAAEPAPAAPAERAPGAVASPAKAAASAPIRRDDDDLADLFEAKPAAPAAAPEKSADAPAASSNDPLPKDPLWFLSKRPLETAGDAPVAAPSQETPAAATAPPGEEGAKLSRPETLRGALPPLFGSGTEAETAKGPAIRTPEAPAAAVAAAAPTAVSSSPLKGENGQAPAEGAKKTAAQAAAAPPGARADKPAPATAPLANGRAGPIAATAGGPGAAPSAAPAGGEAAATQVRAFEQAMANVLEPVLRKWLDNNLPRMVQAAIREELAKAAKATDAPVKE